MLNKIENLLNLADSDNSFLQICTPENLYRAWRKVRANRGVGGIDAVSLKDFEKNLQDNLTELSRNLQDKTYQPLPVKFVRIVKESGKLRELGILTVRDRVAQRAVLDKIEPDFEAIMQDCNFAFRQARNLEMAIQRILVCRANGFWWTVEADIKNYFPSINREILLKDVTKIVSDENVLHLIKLWIDAGILDETWWEAGQKKIASANAVVHEAISESLESFVTQRLNQMETFGEFSENFDEPAELSPFEEEKLNGQKKREAVKALLKEGFWLALAHRTILGKVLGAKVLGVGGLAIAGIALAPTVIETFRQRFHPRKGILQGSPLSPVLANLYLNDFDQFLSEQETQLVRYCDDFVILCRTQEEAKSALEMAKHELFKKGLTLHPDKTRILAPTDEFEFLGYKFLSNGLVEPPPSATAEMARKIRAMSVKAKGKMKDAKFKVKKIKVKSWREFFDIFEKKNKD